MQFFRGKKLDDDCPICLQHMYSKKVKKLVCNHILHTNCYDSMISSNCNKTCPICRCDLTAPVAPVSTQRTHRMCAICKTQIEAQEVRMNDCSCYTHYNCIRKMRKHGEEKYCNCGQKINSRNIDLLDYSNLSDVYRIVIGEIPHCKEKSCKLLGCPNRYGFCETHSRDIVSDTIFSLALQFMVRQSKKENKKERRLLFYRVMVILESYKLNSQHTYQDAVEKLKYHL